MPALVSQLGCSQQRGLQCKESPKLGQLHWLLTTAWPGQRTKYKNIRVEHWGFLTFPHHLHNIQGVADLEAAEVLTRVPG
jgi:hypothetical protein